MRGYMTMVLALLALAGTVSAGYTPITDIGTLSGVVWPDGYTYASSYSRGYAVNDSGQVVGHSESQKGSYAPWWVRGFSWTAAGGIVPLVNPSAWGNGAWAYDVNGSGRVAGRAYIDGSNRRVAVWDAGSSTPTILGTTNKIAGQGVNEAGLVVGADSSTGTSFKWDGTTLTDIGKYGSDATAAIAVNAGGIIVGTHGSLRGCYYDGATWYDMPTLGGSWASALDINDSNVAVGISDVDGSSGKAFKYTVGGSMTALDNLAGYSYGVGYGTNNAGVVVGAAGSTAPAFADIQASRMYGQRAVMWAADGTPTDLNTLIDPALGWTLLRATEISENGRYITGTGLIGGQEHAFLIEIPEPATLSLLGMGALGLVIRRKR